MIKKRDDELSAMAPHAEPQWVDDFVVEQRLLGVPGDRIGDALATVDAHLAETGESAADAFGPAEDYARALAESESGEDGPSMRLGAGTVVSGALGLFGIVVLPRAFEAWLYDAAVTITVGDVVVFGVLAAVAAAIMVFAAPVLRFVVDHPLLAVLAGPVLVVVFVATFILLRQPVLDLPAVPVAVLAVLGLAVSAWLGWRQPVDPVTTPAGATLGSARFARALPALVLPAFALAMCLVTLITWLSS